MLKVDNRNDNFQTQFCHGSISNWFNAIESTEVSLNWKMYDFSVICNWWINLTYSTWKAFNAKCLSLNEESCIVRHTVNEMNAFELKYYLFMINLDKCNGSCNVLSPKIYVPKKTKEINVKVFNMITNINKAKRSVKHISCNCKYKFNSRTCNSNQKYI